MTIQLAIKTLTDRLWFYEGSTKIDGIRCYIMRKYDYHDHSRQTIRYFTAKGLRVQAKREMELP